MQRHLHHRCVRLVLGLSVLCLLSCSSLDEAGQAEQPPKVNGGPPGVANVELPGITIDSTNKRIDVAARIALDEGLLELIACTPDTKGHESIVMIDAVPMHIHAALLLIGANNGNPAMIKPANAEKTRWLHLPPRGDPIAVSLVFQDPQDKKNQIERPISDFLKRAEQAGPFAPEGAQDDKQGEDPAKIFATFLFAGSQVIDDQAGGRQYAADESGNVISISTFGDELLCLPTRQSQENHALAWAVDPTHLPKAETTVILRLTLKKPPKEQP